MLRVDWGNVAPSDEERGRIEARVSSALSVAGSTDSILSLRRRGSGFEASLRLMTAHVRLHAPDLRSAVDRLLMLLDVVARERA